MRTIKAAEAKTQFFRLLDDVEEGESVIVTRHGKRIARIVPETSFEQERVDKSIQEMRKLRARIGKLSLEEILSARDEGRA